MRRALFIFLVVFFPFRDSGYVDDWDTKYAKKKMRESVYYSQIQEIKELPSGGVQLSMEVGNYAWGGYIAVVITERKDSITIHSYDSYRDESGVNVREVDRKEFDMFYDQLVALGIWNMKDHLSIYCDDCSTHFFALTDLSNNVRAIIYALGLLDKHPLRGDSIDYQAIRELIVDFANQNQ